VPNSPASKNQPPRIGPRSFLSFRSPKAWWLDIGDTLSPYNHPDIAAAIVKPFVSEANHFMVEQHGVFQGYYFWDYIGMDGNAREAFRDSPHFDYTEEFCRLYDQTAFDASYTSNPLEHYEPLIRKVLG